MWPCHRHNWQIIGYWHAIRQRHTPLLSGAAPLGHEPVTVLSYQCRKNAAHTKQVTMNGHLPNLIVAKQ